MHYPRLVETLIRWSYAEVLWICLGPNQTFFAKYIGTYDYLLPSAISSQINVDEGEITALALGIDETYFIRQGHEYKKSDLKGHYPKLAAGLDEYRRPIVCSPESSEPGLWVTNIVCP